MGFSLQSLLIVIASLVVEHRLNSCGSQETGRAPGSSGGVGGLQEGRRREI